MIFDRLRSETAQLHKDIEAANPIMKPWLTRDDYVAYLQRLLPFIDHIEDEIYQRTSGYHDVLAIEQRKRAPLLRKDLENLGSDAASLYDQDDFQIISFSEALGALYVLEGSTLGGQVISKHLKEKLNLTDDQLHFFQGHKEKTGKMWQDFKTRFQSHLTFVDDEVVNGAMKTFRKYTEVTRATT